MSQRFEKNLELWAKERPVEALRLQYSSYPLPEWKLYEIDSQEEASQWYKNLPLDHAKVLYIYGIGYGEYYLPLKKWLKKDSEHRVVFLEDEKGVLQHFFARPLATQMLKDPQVIICSLEAGVLETLYWSFVLSPFAVTALKSYQNNKPFEELKKKIAYETAMKNALVEEYLKYGAAFFRNFYPNMLHLSGSYWGNALFGKFKGVPAIICGAGPSLEKHLANLPALKEKALVFAGGSALNALANKRITPHFGAGIDPNSTQALRLDKTEANVPFFYRSRMNAEAVSKITGQKLYISGVGGYDIAEYYEKKLGLEADFLDEGHNVINFCSEIAVRMGCNPIIYIGLDLAFTEMKAYAEGIDESLVSEQELLSTRDEEKRGIYREDIFGKPVLTLWKWVAESEWLSNFAISHPETTFINATEGGIGIREVPNQPLTALPLKEDPLPEIQTVIQAASMPHVSKEILKIYTVELKESLQKCKEIIGKLIEEIEKEKLKVETNGILTSGESALLETDLYAEPGYIYVLDIFHQVYVRVQNKKAVQIRLNKKGATLQQLALQKLDLQKEKLQFIDQVAESNIILINHYIEYN